MLSKIRNESRVRNSSATRIAGFISGSVIFVKRCQAVAPSTFAAFCRSSGTSESPASSSSPMNGVVFQISAMMMTTMASHLIGQRRAVVERRGQVALARRPRVLPAVGGGDRHDPVRDERGGADRTPAEQRPVQDHGQQHAEHQRDRDREDRDDQGHHQRVPPVRGAEHRAVVGEPDELDVLRQFQVVALQRQVDRVADRVSGDRDHHDDRRRAQQPAEPALGPRAFRQLRLAVLRRLPPRCAAVTSGW